MRTPHRQPSAGFTLVEVLVVIAILATLAGLITASVNMAMGSAEVKNCKNEINRLGAAIDAYLNSASLGDYPPTSLERWYNVAGNGINDGIESLVAHLATKNAGGPFYEFSDDALQNLDKDTLENVDLFTELNWQFAKNELFEIVDPWGNPYVYIHNNDYERTFVMLTDGGKRFTVTGASSEKTGTFHAPTTYQLWSFGPDGEDNGGEGDDITSW